MASEALLRLGTRGSPLALAQAREVRQRLAAAHGDLAPEDAVEIVPIKTTGDRIQDRTLSEAGGKGLFTKEIEEALLAGHIDAAVHSMKDVPTWHREGLGIAAILPREDPRDALFCAPGETLATLPPGTVIGTAALRRQAQILLARPDLKVAPLRGNVQTRLRKLAEGQVGATLLALAGLKRLGVADQATEILSPEVMLPAVAQGAIGIEARLDDTRARTYIAALNDPISERRVAAERACLESLDGSCRTPIAALALWDGGETKLHLRTLICLPDGTQAHRATCEGAATDAERLGREAGETLRAAAGPAFFDILAAS